MKSEMGKKGENQIKNLPFNKRFNHKNHRSLFGVHGSKTIIGH
jgi:hypothetical protein